MGENHHGATSTGWQKQLTTLTNKLTTLMLSNNTTMLCCYVAGQRTLNSYQAVIPLLSAYISYSPFEHIIYVSVIPLQSVHISYFPFWMHNICISYSPFQCIYQLISITANTDSVTDEYKRNLCTCKKTKRLLKKKSHSNFMLAVHAQRLFCYSMHTTTRLLKMYN